MRYISISIYLILGLLVSFLLVSCGTDSQPNSQSQSFSEQRTPGAPRASSGVDSLFSIGTDSTDLLYEIEDISVQFGSACYIYVLDRGSYKLKKYNSKGNLISETGKKGYGPGEFRNPESLAIMDNVVVVSEQRSPRAHIFFDNLKYKKDIVLDNIPLEMEYLKNKNIAISGLPVQSKPGFSNFLKFSTSDYDVSSIEIPTPKLPDQVKTASQEYPLLKGVWTGGHIATHGDTVVVAFLYHNRVVAIRNDEQIWTHTITEISDIPEIKDVGDRPMPAQKLLTGVATDHRGNTYVLLGSGNAPNRAVYVLDKNGKKRHELLLPYKTNSIAWSPPNRLYTEEGGGTRIGAYRITPTSN